jgi:glycosyltransferase 2 family protein
MRADTAAPAPQKKRARTPDALGTRRTSGAPDAKGSGITSRAWWPAAKRILTLLFFVAVLGLVANQARNVEWSAVVRSMRAYSAPVLLAAAALSAASYAVYCTFDLIGRYHVGHALPTVQVVRVGFVAYAFSLSLGSLVGGVALRYRLYSRLGLKADAIAQIIVLSVISNWLGYLFLAGTVFVLHPLALPPEWKFDSGSLRLLGAALWAVAIGYVVLCRYSPGRVWCVRGHELRLPSWRIALLQFVLSSINWLAIAGVIYVLLQFRIDYPSVLSVLLLAAVAGVIAHVPAGLGVLEAVFVALLLHRSSQAALLGALLAYRAIYYLLPLAVATVAFLAIDSRGPAEAAASQAARAAPSAESSKRPHGRRGR